MFDEPGFPRVDDSDAAAPTLYILVYCSRAAEGVDVSEVGRISEFAQRRNLVSGITGLLVFGSAVFFQWIEGPPAQVQDLIVKLRGDPRHYDVVSLDWSEEKRERLYTNWEMEQVKAEDIGSVLRYSLGSGQDETNVAALTRILEHVDSGRLKELEGS